MRKHSPKNGACFVCLSPYWHRNLHNELLVDKVKVMSAYELDTLPLLWRNVMFKNTHFCEHVCHSWLSRSMWLKKLNTNRSYKPAESMDFEFLRKEALRLENMMDEVMAMLKRRQQISDCREYLLIFANRTYSKKNQLTWQPSKGQNIVGSWYGLAEALIEQYCSYLDLEDVHEREQRLLIWKHYAIALTHHLVDLNTNSRKC
ncbi:unnamed protein product [Caenorhabditis auriculariae]|uniref:Uncharacterized protein n=1 Tax=Caenorhabditis auriculariae TaxID=2777116 RepID=A0A8S1HV62_9PELO|nr:unnamed protein product [Caenorhabditis auriculariae]